LKRWEELEAEAPALAEAGRALLYQFGPGLGYLATVRADGAPRLHPVCPHVHDGSLWVFVGRESPKRADLLRDGRYALHTFPCVDVDDEFSVSGVARAAGDPQLDAAVRATMRSNVGADDQLFELRIDRALHAKYGPRPSWPPTYTRWRA
jgi:hypothetical protein